MNFTLKGQLIHGSQQLYDLDEPYRKNRDGSFKLSQGKYQFNTYADDEVRVTAFKSMLRYWFRAFALGVLTINEVQEWEGKLFGLIQPTQHKNTAWVKFNLINGKTIELEDECNKQKGTLILSYSPFIPEDYKNIIVDLFNNLIWLTFRLGAVGQGARRPYYERNSNPWYRGTNIYLKNPDDDKFWSITSNGEQLCIRFRNKIKRFYKVLERLTNNTDLINNISNQFAQVTNHQWSEVVDTNCQILLIPKHKNIGKKTPALKLLHQDFHHLENQWNDLKKEVKELKNKNKYRESKEKQKQANEIYAQMKSLCGGVNTEKDFFGKGKDRGATPSPIWIKDLDIFEVVTVFGATQNPRKEFLKKLQDNADSYYQIFPL